MAESLIGPGRVLLVGAVLAGLSVPGFAILGRAGFIRSLSVPFRIALAVAVALALHVIVAFGLERAGISFGVAVWVSGALALAAAPFALPFFRMRGSWLGPTLLGAALWGAKDAATLMDYEPDYVFHDPQQLTSLLPG